ncbi:MAG: peptidylprolyl isomerase [Bacteroidia bacterium]|nr:peptidylprolyl isomerase [Bacteroidia bacterium]MCX7652340.1 peptidylprolyl isomerase [Bacteroidia bacterium]MDW8417548.1 peptidylprolyl isomerase [Bacteroidia bacterium]
MRYILAALLTATMWAQEWNKRQTELARIGKNIKVSQAEFEYAYAKAHGGWNQAKSHTPEQYRSYLEAYLNFRRKVADAQARKLDTVRSFREEYEGYLRQLAKPYLLEKEVLDTLLRQIYARMKEEIRASHILITIRDEDTATAYKRLLSLRDSILKGQISFSEAARLYSEDPSAAQNKGDLGYFSAFDMVAPFEDAAYATAVGSISMPVRTRFGYHLVYVQERTPHAGQRKAAHILVRWGPTYAAKDSIEAERRIREVYARLQKGEKWEDLVRDFSDDPMSASRGGELGWMRLFPQMEAIKRTLPAGAYSEPFRTRFGWHILKVVEVKPIGSFEEMRSELKSRLQRDERYKAAERAYFDRRLSAYKYTENKSVRQSLYNALDSLYPDLDKALSSLPAAMLNSVLFTLNKQKHTVRAFLSFWANNRGYQIARKLSPEVFDEVLRSFAHEKVLDIEIQNLPKRYPEFELLRREYYYGVLFFNISEQEVWRKAVEDTAGLRAYYEAQRTNFPAGERLELIEIVSTDSVSLTELLRRLPNPSLASIDSLNRAGRYGWRILPQFVAKDKAEATYMPYFNNGNSLPTWTPLRGSGREWKIAYILRQLPAGYKTFEEVRVELVQKYQDELEKRWVARLQQSYPAQINEKVFARLFK